MKPLLGPEDAVSGVTKAGNYVGVLVEVVIHSGNVDVYVRVLLLYALNAFHGAGWAKVDLGKGKELNIVTLHTWPHPFKYNAPDRDASAKALEGHYFRAAEMQYICQQTIATVPGAARQWWLMTGDFNAISSVDNYHYQKDLSDPVFLVHDYVRNNTPYIDVIERMYPGEFQSSTLVGRRIDMVYVTPALFERVLKASTIYDGFAKASRYPRGKEVNNRSW